MAAAQLTKNFLPFSVQRNPSPTINAELLVWQRRSHGCCRTVHTFTSDSLCYLPKAKVYSGKVQLQLNIHERRQVAPCPIACPIRSETPGTTRRGKRGTARSREGKHLKGKVPKQHNEVQNCNLGRVFFGFVLKMSHKLKPPKTDYLWLWAEAPAVQIANLRHSCKKMRDISPCPSHLHHPSALLISCPLFETVAGIVTSWGHCSTLVRVLILRSRLWDEPISDLHTQISAWRWERGGEEILCQAKGWNVV